MSHRPWILTVTAVVVAPVVLAAPLAEDAFKPSEYELIGRKLAAYLHAREENQSVDKVQGEIEKDLKKIEDRLKKSPLALPGEMGKALLAAYSIDKKPVPQGKVSTDTIPAYWEPKGKLTFAVRAPTKYEAKNSYPLILCVPDQSEKPSDYLTEKWTDNTVKEGAVVAAASMPADAGAWLEGITTEKETGSGNIATLLKHLTRLYSIDPDRVYLAGSGKGVELAMLYASRFGDRFAGVIGRSGDPTDVTAENLKLLPCFLAGAGGKASALQEKLKALGYDNCTLSPEGKEADIWSWMQANPRHPNPTEVVLYPTVPVPNRSYWLEVVPTDATTAFVKAKADRATNTITIDAEGVTKVVLYFNDVLLDLDKPVKVVRNGQEKSDLIVRSLPRTLDMIGGSRSDATKFYVNKNEYDVPPKPKPK